MLVSNIMLQGPSLLLLTRSCVCCSALSSTAGQECLERLGKRQLAPSLVVSMSHRAHQPRAWAGPQLRMPLPAHCLVLLRLSRAARGHAAAGGGAARLPNGLIQRMASSGAGTRGCWRRCVIKCPPRAKVARVPAAACRKHASCFFFLLPRVLQNCCCALLQGCGQPGRCRWAI